MPYSATEDWWQYDDSNSSMVHMATGEQVVFCGEVDLRGRLIWRTSDIQAPRRTDGKPDYNPGWFLFEYVFESEIYPILVGMGLFSYPNPDNIPRGDGGRTEEDRIGPRIHGWAWIIDHNRSFELRRSFSKADEPEPGYNLWKRVDRAITEVAFLWPGAKWWESSRGQRPAREIALRGGWINGSWRPDLQRRIGTDVGLLHYAAANSPTQPLSDFVATTATATEQWSLLNPDTPENELTQREWRLGSRPSGHILTVLFEEREAGPPPKITTTDNKTGISTVKVLHRGPPTQSFGVEAKFPGGGLQFKLEKRNEFPDPADQNPTIYRYDGIGRSLFPFGADWKAVARLPSYDQSLVLVDLYMDALIPLTNGLLGPFSPPTLSPACLALYGVPLAGTRRGIMMATFENSLPPDRAMLGWSDFFF